MSPSMQTDKKPEWQTLHPRLNLISILLLNFKMDILNTFLLIIIFNKTGSEWNKNPTQGQCLKLLHTVYREKETEGNTEKKQNCGRIRSVVVPK